jgi:hypothetical protein
MTEKDLAKIGRELGIVLPKDYRRLMLSQAAELKALTHEINGTTYGWFDETLYLEATRVIETNLIERKLDSGTGYAFSEWWKTFFLIGSNGAGDYYCLRLDRDVKVWMIGSDCGDKPSEMYPSLSAFVVYELKRYREQLGE